MRPVSSISVVVLGSIYLAACSAGPSGGGGSSGMRPDGTCDLDAPACAEGQVCELVVDGDPQCATPVVLRGVVVVLGDETPVEGALVQAVDANGTAVGITGISASDGTYSLVEPAVRDADGRWSLHASCSGGRVSGVSHRDPTSPAVGCSFGGVPG